MALPYEFSLALRYLRPKRTFVSVITLISVAGVMLGVAVLMVVISVMTGFDRELRERLVGFNAHMKVIEEGQAMLDYEEFQSTIERHPQVKGAAPFLVWPVLVETQPADGPGQVHAPWLKGVDQEMERRVSNVHTNIIEGEYDLSGPGVVVGVGLAEMLGLRVGDRVSVLSFNDFKDLYKDADDALAAIPLPDEYEVRGIFDVGYFELNSNLMLCSLENAQDLYDLDDAVHGITVMLKDPFQADAVRRELSKDLTPSTRISIWTEENSILLDALVVEKSVMFYVLFVIMIVAAFGIMNSLITFVVQKTHDIGMLKALGATRTQVVTLFLSQSMFVGFVGVLSGFGLGMLLIIYRNDFLSFMRQWTGLKLFPPEIYGFTKLPALIVTEDILVICGSALIICILAGALPAWIAARLQPVEALRHE